MGQNSTHEDHLSSPEIVELVSERLEELRKRLLDSSRRNPLVNITFRANSTSVLRVVDELPDILRFKLTGGTAMRLVPLPALEEELPDEQTDEFLNVLHPARTEDEDYLTQLDALDPDGTDFEQKVLLIERALKDRIRTALGATRPSISSWRRRRRSSPKASTGFGVRWSSKP